MKIITIALLFITSLTQGQITKGNWLVGGNGNIRTDKPTGVAGGDTKYTFITLNNNLGYFFTNKFAGGLKLELQKGSSKDPQPDQTVIILKQGNYSIGPFVRYYYLNLEKRGNIFNEISYGYRRYFSKSGTDSYQKAGSDNKFNISLGGVLFLNTTVGVEVIGTYSSSKRNEIDAGSNSFSLNIGLQLHLERDK